MENGLAHLIVVIVLYVGFLFIRKLWRSIKAGFKSVADSDWNKY